MARKLSGPTALITGAARGLGVNIAERLGSDGANIMLVDINEEGLSEAAEQVAAAGAPQVGCCVHDLGVESGANSAEVSAMVAGGLSDPRRFAGHHRADLQRQRWTMDDVTLHTRTGQR